mmetsp:Transcript_5162/g.12145  ORF Transcript_5162/g.12145 Transcript_5162/m.12145 type:complete len:414 (-) Transcript_5162:121-1362(-)
MGDATPIGVFFARGPQQVERAWGHVKTQVLGSFIIMGWGAVTTFTMLTAINQVPCLRLRVPRDREMEGMDSFEHSMGHEDLSFKRTIEELVSNVAQGQSSHEHVQKVFRLACKNLALVNIMPQLPYKARPALHQRPSDVCISVTVQNLEGVKQGHRSRLGCISKPGIYVSVEPVSAVAEDGKLMIHHKYFAPRYTEVMTDEPYDFEHTFHFNNFFIPHGVEDFTFLLFGIHINERRVMEAHLRVMEALMDDHGHSVGGVHALVPYSTRSGKASTEQGVKLHLRVGCPKKSRLGSKSLSKLLGGYSSSGSRPPMSTINSAQFHESEGEASVALTASAALDAFSMEPHACLPNATPGINLVTTQNLNSRVELLEQQVQKLIEDRTLMTHELAKEKQAVQSLKQQMAALKKDSSAL